MDPFDEFEFKPLTEGLGFHKKAEKLKQDVQLSKMSDEKIGRSVPERPPAQMLKQNSKSILDDDDDLGANVGAERPASKSITDLIAALPPSLDFLEGDNEAGNEKPASASTEMNYPLITKRKRGGSDRTADRSGATSQGIPSKKSTEKVMEASRPQIFQPLGRAEYTPPLHQPAPQDRANVKSMAASAAASAATLGSTPASPSISARASNIPPQPTLKSPLKSPAAPSKIDESYSRSFPHAEKTKAAAPAPAPAAETKTGTAAAVELKKASASFAAAILDGMAILGLSTIFLVIILMITRVDLVAMLAHAKTTASTQFHMLLLFLSVMQLYMLSSRAFFGSSLGEWAFDMQMGTDADFKKAKYPVQVLWRMILVLATGVIVLPILSKLTGRDLFAALGGPQIYRRSN